MPAVAERPKKKTAIETIKLDIACGQTKQPGYVGIDISKIPGVDIVHDLEKTPWPIKNNSVSEAFCSHFIEHVKNLPAFMDELHRVLVVGGKAAIVCPYYTSMRCWQDPFHIRAISEATFLYFNKDWRISQKLDHYPIACDFDFSYGYAFYPEWAARHEEARAFALKHYNNVVSDIHVTLVKK